VHLTHCGNELRPILDHFTVWPTCFFCLEWSRAFPYLRFIFTTVFAPHDLLSESSHNTWPLSKALTQPGRYSCWPRCTRPWPPKSVADARRIACCSPPVSPNQWHPLLLGSRKQPSWDSWETGCCCRRLFGLRSGHSLQTARAVRPYAHRRRAAGHAGYSASICCW